MAIDEVDGYSVPGSPLLSESRTDASDTILQATYIVLSSDGVIQLNVSHAAVDVLTNISEVCWTWIKMFATSRFCKANVFMDFLNFKLRDSDYSVIIVKSIAFFVLSYNSQCFISELDIIKTDNHTCAAISKTANQREELSTVHGKFCQITRLYSFFI